MNAEHEIFLLAHGTTTVVDGQRLSITARGVFARSVIAGADDERDATFGHLKRDSLVGR